jgi:hypothetical protein
VASRDPLKFASDSRIARAVLVRNGPSDTSPWQIAASVVRPWPLKVQVRGCRMSRRSAALTRARGAIVHGNQPPRGRPRAALFCSRHRSQTGSLRTTTRTSSSTSSPSSICLSSARTTETTCQFARRCFEYRMGGFSGDDYRTSGAHETLAPSPINEATQTVPDRCRAGDVLAWRCIETSPDRPRLTTTARQVLLIGRECPT